MNGDIEFILRLLWKEAWARKRLVVALYLLTSLSFAGLAWIWPQVYTSSSIVIVADKNILRPLMQGTAVTTALIDPSKMAKQIMHSRKALTEILTTHNWIDENTTAEEIDLLMEKIRAKTEQTNMGSNIIQISYKDKDPVRAYQTAKGLTDIFVRESQLTKQRESRSAFEFIDSQASVYHIKLKDAEQAIKEFQTKNIDSTPGSKDLTNERMIQLQRQLESIDIEIASIKSKLIVQQNQLTDEGSVKKSASVTQEGILRTRVAELKTRLENLRLVYKETYPDIIQVKSQIASTEKKIIEEIRSRNISEFTGSNINSQNELANSHVTRLLQSQVLKAKSDILALQSRRTQFFMLLEQEREKIGRINAVEAEMTELKRDYEVNKVKYNQLVEQRENARISMNIDIANQGLTTRVQEEASIPANPKGIRFSQLILAGLVLSFAIPLLVVYGLAMLDQKIRDKRIIFESLELPILASLQPVKTASEKRMRILKSGTIALVVAISWSIYGYEIWLRAQG